MTSRYQDAVDASVAAGAGAAVVVVAAAVGVSVEAVDAVAARHFG